MSSEVVRHLHHDPARDLVALRGVIPGPDAEKGDWRAGHDRDLRPDCVFAGAACCATGLFPEALGGWAPVIMEEED